MTIRAKSVVFKRDGEYTIFSKVYDVEKIEEPSHLDLVNKAIKNGFSDKDFLALSTSTWDPFTIELYPELTQKAMDKIKSLIKKDIVRILRKKVDKKILNTSNLNCHGQ
jgi:hypothetical protein